MNKSPSWLNEKTIILPNGGNAVWSYDTEGDFLEIFFQDSPATATIELAEGVFLRLDREQQQPLSIGFIAASHRLQQQEFGYPLLKLSGINKVSQTDRQMILAMLQRPPLNAILHLYSFKSSPRTQTIPVAAFNQPVPMPV